MPGRDRTGPMGKGPMTGWKAGVCSGKNSYETTNSAGGQGGQGRGQGKGRGGMGGYGVGSAGQGETAMWVCAKCGESVPHERGVACLHMKCPKCGFPMTRKD